MLPSNHRHEGTFGNTLSMTLIGYWEGKNARGWPNVRDFVDENWDEDERDLVALYLEQGVVIPRGFLQRGFSNCRFCGKSNGCLDLTDHVYVWPEGLAHYVREHGVRVPDSVVRHIVNWSYLDVFDVNRDWWKTATLDS